MSEGDVTLYGASDDLIEVEGNVPGCDEYNAVSAHFTLVGKDAMVRVKVWYTSRGVWAIGCAPVEEDESMLAVELMGEGYTAKATVRGVRQVDLIRKTVAR